MGGANRKICATGADTRSNSTLGLGAGGSFGPQEFLSNIGLNLVPAIEVDSFVFIEKRVNLNQQSPYHDPAVPT